MRVNRVTAGANPVAEAESEPDRLSLPFRGVWKANREPQDAERV